MDSIGSGTTTPRELTAGIWRWTARHPDWHPSGFGDEVAAFALATADCGLLVDPLLPEEDPEPVLALIDELAAKRLAVLITIPYHVRSAEEIWRRHPKRTTIHGHPAAVKRLKDTSAFVPIEPGAQTLPARVTAHSIGSPRRYEHPLYVPEHDALAFGDAVVEVDGALRVWEQVPADAKRERWYRERFLPTLEPLLDLDADRVLVTHGEPVLKSGRANLKKALAAEPWSRHTD
jgi:hypothetical protein